MSKSNLGFEVEETAHTNVIK